MRRPNFFIVGAPKCGTTAVAAWLAEHPQVYFSPVKEPHFFNSDGLTKTESLAEYERLFEGAAPHHLAVGEGSTHYLYSRTAIPAIEQYVENARYVVCLRNPVEMVPALHAERVLGGRETETDCEKAWRLQGERAAGRRIPRRVTADPERLQYGRYCRLGEQLARVYELIPRDRVLTVLLDDLRREPAGEYRRLLDFLGLDHDGRNVFPVVNVARQARSAVMSALSRAITDTKRKLGIRWSTPAGRRLGRMNVREAPRPELNSAFRDELAGYFSDDVVKLEALLARDLSAWKPRHCEPVQSDGGAAGMSR